MLDSPLDGDIAGGRTAKERGHLDVVEGTADEVVEPAREGCLLKDLEDPGVVDGVKGLGSVKQEGKPLLVICNALIEKTVEVLSE